jgi:outer membrane protein TolC
MKKYIIVLLLFSQVGYTQNLTLKDCYQKAIESNPVSKDKVLLEQITALKVKNLKTNYLPKLDFTGQATYQSDVVKIDLDLPYPGIEIPSPTKDQYKVTLDVSQIIYDGGATKNQKNLEEKILEADRQQVEVTLYQLKETVNQVYFTVLLLQEQEKVLKLLLDEIDERIKVAESGVENGVLKESDLLSLQAEEFKIKQQLTELNYNRKSGISVLSELINLETEEITGLEIPLLDIKYDQKNQRPEIELYQNQKERLVASGLLLKSKRMPKLLAFGQFGYGRPGLNMLNDEFDTYYIVGAKLTWNIFDWNTNQREREILKAQADRVINQEEAFIQISDVEKAKQFAEVEKYEDLLESDKNIIELREAVVISSASQLDNGTITATDYLSILNAEKQARINQSIHEIRLLHSKANYLVKNGN